jgi:Protein of unknown function (DUF3489)
VWGGSGIVPAANTEHIMSAKKTVIAKNAKLISPAQASTSGKIEGGKAPNDETTKLRPAARGGGTSIKPPRGAMDSIRAASKLSRLEELLRRPKGATVAQLSAALGWQKHSVRGAMSGTLKKRGLGIVSEERKGERIYRIIG